MLLDAAMPFSNLEELEQSMLKAAVDTQIKTTPHSAWSTWASIDCNSCFQQICLAEDISRNSLNDPRMTAGPSAAHSAQLLQDLMQSPLWSLPLSPSSLGLLMPWTTSSKPALLPCPLRLLARLVLMPQQLIWLQMSQQPHGQLHRQPVLQAPPGLRTWVTNCWMIALMPHQALPSITHQPPGRQDRGITCLILKQSRSQLQAASRSKSHPQLPLTHLSSMQSSCVSIAALRTVPQ